MLDELKVLTCTSVYYVKFFNFTVHYLDYKKTKDKAKPSKLGSTKAMRE